MMPHLPLFGTCHLYMVSIDLVVVELSILMGAGSCGCPIVWRMIRRGTAICALLYVPIVSDSVPEDTMCLNVLYYI